MTTDIRVRPRDLPRLLLVMAAIGVCVFVVYGAQPSAPPERLHELAERLHRVLEDRVANVLQWEHAQHAALREVARDERLLRDVEASLGGAAIALDGRLDRACLRFAGCAVYDTAGHRLGAFRVREAPHGLVPAALAGQTSTSHVVATDSVGALRPQLADARFSIFFSTPLELSGGRTAVLVSRVDADESLDPIMHQVRFGRTGEAYVFDERGYMVTRSRFEPQSPGDRRGPLVFGRPSVALRTPTEAPTLAVASVRRGRTLGMDLDGYVDYRGVVVVGAWHWIEGLGAGVVTEIDLSEALYAPSTL